MDSNMEETNSTTFDAKQFVSNCSFLGFSNLNDQSAVSLKRFLSNAYDLHIVSFPTLSSALSLLSQMSTTNLSLMLLLQLHGGQEKGWSFPNKQDQRLNRKNHKQRADVRCQPSDMDMYIFLFERRAVEDCQSFDAMIILST